MIKTHIRIWLWVHFYTILRWLSAIFFIFLTVAGLIVLTYNVGPYIENKFFPVASKFAIDHWAVEDNNKLRIHPVIDKVRACGIQNIDAYVTDKGPSDRFTRTELEVLGPYANRPVGVQHLNALKLDIPDFAGAGSEFFLVYTYRCHPFWPSQVQTRKFSVPIDGQDFKMGDYVDSEKWWVDPKPVNDPSSTTSPR